MIETFSIHLAEKQVTGASVFLGVKHPDIPDIVVGPLGQNGSIFDHVPVKMQENISHITHLFPNDPSFFRDNIQQFLTQYDKNQDLSFFAIIYASTIRPQRPCFVQHANFTEFLFIKEKSLK